MRVAVVLGVSIYADPKYNLPACRNDADPIADLLRATGAYGDVLKLVDKQPTVAVKEKLVDFFERHHGEEIEEALFYYTGHGEFMNNEFYFLLTDFTASRRKQTSLQNSELDGWLRQLEPEVTIKIVDACQAGVHYIKDPTAFKKYLQSTPERFNRCYFMFSSQRDEPSYQDSDLSYFTRSFGRAILEFQSDDIRYKDIIDTIADEFENNGNQTPFFVTQATNTERFATVTHEVREALRKYVKTTTASVVPDSALPAKETLLQFVIRDAERYCSIEEFLERMDMIKNTVESFRFSDELSDLFSIHYEFVDELPKEDQIPRFDMVGKWLQNSDHEYFAQPTYRSEEYFEETRVPKQVTGVLAGLISPFETEIHRVRRTRRVVEGMTLTLDVPYRLIRVRFAPQFENLNGAFLLILFVVSKTAIRFFYISSELKPKNWVENEAISEESWRTVETPLKDEDGLKLTMENILRSFADSRVDILRKKYLPASIKEEVEPEVSEEDSDQEVQRDAPPDKE